MVLLNIFFVANLVVIKSPFVVNIVEGSTLLLTDPFLGDFGCIVNGQLSLDRTDPVGGSRGVMMKLYIGKPGWL